MERNIIIDVSVAREIWVLHDGVLPIKNSWGSFTVVYVPLLSVCVWAIYSFTFHHFEHFRFLVF